MLGTLAYSNAKKLEKRVDLLEASYPIIRDGLVMWLDARAQKGLMSKGYDKNVWLDLSHTGNDGQLRNFNHDGVSGWNEGLNFCIDCGAGCHGCAEPTFYKEVTPLYADSTGLAKEKKAEALLAKSGRKKTKIIKEA